MNERVRRRLELRRSNAARPHRNKARFDKSTRHDWKGLVMWETVESGELKDIVVQREGSAQRTVEELMRVFIADCRDVTGEQRFEGLLAEFDEVNARDKGGYEAVCFENLSAIADDAESWLVDAGYVVEWNDGYTIFEA